MNTIWIVSHTAGAPSFCPRLPEYMLAKKLQSKGYKVYVIAASAIHNTTINFIKDKKLYKKQIVDDVPFIFIKTRQYTNKISRVFNMLDFYFNLLRVYKKFPKPDTIISVIPDPLACLSGLKAAKELGIPHITYILDLWPLSIVEYAGFSERNPIIQLLYGLERRIYVNSSSLVFTWEGAYDYIIDKKWDDEIPKEKFNYINIGVDIETFNYNLAHYSIEDSDLEDNTYKVMYCGSVREANDIGTLVECAKRIKISYPEIKMKFIIYGDGPDRKVLEQKCVVENIDNVVFKGNIDKKYIPFVLSKSNLNILNLKPASTQKYGNSSNKLFEYFAAGNPVIANIDEGKYPIISKYQCGLIVDSKSIEQYMDGILYFYNLNVVDMERYKTNAKKAAIEFDTNNLNEAWVNIVKSNLVNPVKKLH